VQFALTVPTIADRVAQTVAKMVLEPVMEPIFHSDSYGYRPRRSALDAVGMARKRCWDFDWVIDLDIRAFFDSIPHDLIEKAVAHHTELASVAPYVYWPVAACPGRAFRRNHPREDERHPARRCRKSALVESLSALWVRCVDAADLPEQSVREVR
jgi:Reverse transcriptase (RNA-dependent DNA polymerase)